MHQYVFPQSLSKQEAEYCFAACLRLAKEISCSIFGMSDACNSENDFYWNVREKLFDFKSDYNVDWSEVLKRNKSMIFCDIDFLIKAAQPIWLYLKHDQELLNKIGTFLIIVFFLNYKRSFIYNSNEFYRNSKKVFRSNIKSYKT